MGKNPQTLTSGYRTLVTKYIFLKVKYIFWKNVNMLHLSWQKIIPEKQDTRDWQNKKRWLQMEVPNSFRNIKKNKKSGISMHKYGDNMVIFVRDIIMSLLLILGEMGSSLESIEHLSLMMTVSCHGHKHLSVIFPDSSLYFYSFSSTWLSCPFYLFIKLFFVFYLFIYFVWYRAYLNCPSSPGIRLTRLVLNSICLPLPREIWD